MKNKMYYTAPEVEVLQVEVEAGFAASNIGGNALPEVEIGGELNAASSLNEVLLNQW